MMPRHRKCSLTHSPDLPKKQMRSNAGAVFEQIIAQARQPVFYASLGVPDTVEGRFEIITLHMFIILRRLQDKVAHNDAHPPANISTTRNYDLFAQYIFDAMFDNMDDNLRELGVGDLSVGKKVRALAEAFYGRIGAYEAALNAADPETALCAAISRNVLPRDHAEKDRGAMPQKGALAILTDYILRANEGVARRSRDRLVMGIVYFPQIRCDLAVGTDVYTAALPDGKSF